MNALPVSQGRLTRLVWACLPGSNKSTVVTSRILCHDIFNCNTIIYLILYILAYYIICIVFWIINKWTTARTCIKKVSQHSQGGEPKCRAQTQGQGRCERKLYLIKPGGQKLTYKETKNWAGTKKLKYIKHRWTELIINTSDKHYTNDAMEKQVVSGVGAGSLQKGSHCDQTYICHVHIIKTTVLNYLKLTVSLNWHDLGMAFRYYTCKCSERSQWNIQCSQ